MAEKPIVFACANPVPEIYPYAAKSAGAFIVATGRGDFPNQINNSLGFPGILKGALLVRSRNITDAMAIKAAYALANFAEQRGISPDNIIPQMDEVDVFPYEAAEVASQAIKEGVARKANSYEDLYLQARTDILHTRETCQKMMKDGNIPPVPTNLIEEALKYTNN
jgi:malate dehydrogenase (oxaloacetate-decarboxylating)